MQEEKISNIASELDEIFKYLEKDVLAKIPKDLKEQITKKKNPNHKFKIDKNKGFEEQDLMEDTKQILSVIYVEYCCTDAERRQIFDSQARREEKENEEKIGLERLEEIFNQNTEIYTQNDYNKDMIKLDNVSWYKKIINIIKNIFK